MSLWSHSHPDIQNTERFNKKRKLQTIISHVHWCSICSINPYKLNRRTHQNVIHHYQVGFNPEMHGWFNIRKSVNVLCHINKLREKKPHDHSQQSIKKCFDKIQYFFMIKVLERWGIKNAYISIIKAIYSKLLANIKLNKRYSKQFHQFQEQDKATQSPNIYLLYYIKF